MTRRPAEDDTVAQGRAPGRRAPDHAAGPPDGAAAAAADELPPLTRLADRYQIVGLLGRGGMGAVYLAMDEVLGGKPVALKLVAPELEDQAPFEGLRREVLLAQQVTHRNVCRIYDLERIDGRWMIKMEWVAGETLAARVARGRLAIDQALAIARQIADGLDAAHQQGVVHRDLKPGNVMIEESSGRVVLMDFGIAQAATGDLVSDHAGTPAFMAPEQVRGARVDARSDVHGLGAVLYFMLTGEPPFPAAAAATLDLRAGERHAPPPDPRSRRPELPPWLARAILTMLATDPARRPVDAAAARRLLAGPRRRRLLALAAVTAVAVAGVAVVAVVMVVRSPVAPAPWRPQLQEIEPAFDENVDSVAWSPDGSRLAFSSDRERPGWLRARVRRVDGDAEEVAVSPPDKNALFVSWTGDGQALLFTDITDDMSTWRVPVGGGPAERIGTGYAVACGANLLRFEFSSPGCPNCPRFVLRDPAGAEREVLRLDRLAFVSTYRCDRAGRRVVWSRAEQGAPFYQPADLWLADLATGTPRQLTSDRRRNAYPTFTPDGASVVFASARGGAVMNLWELPLDGGPARQLTFGDGNDLLPDVSPDGTRVAFTVDVTSAPLFAHTAGGGARARLTPARVILVHPQATPDGREIIATDFGPLEPRIVAVRIADGAVRALADGVIATVTPDGATVVVASGGTTAAVVQVPLAGGAPRPLATLDGRVRALRAGPDGVVHAMLDRGAVIEAWRVPLDGSAPAREAETPWCFVQPAPAGGWSLWIRCSEAGPVAGALVAPGARPDPAAAPLRMDGQLFFGGDFDARGQAFYLWEEPALRRIDVATGAVTTLFEAAVFGATVAPDGATVYTTEPVGRARRHIIGNFAARRRRP